MPSIGQKLWAIPEGYIPSTSNGPAPELTSHEAVCVLNASADDANVELILFFEDRSPVGPFRIKVGARRTRHIRLNDLSEPATIPRDTNFSTVVRSDVPVVVQHTRLDSRQAANALLTTIAYPVQLTSPEGDANENFAFTW
jgi:hypothetical protein